MCNPETEATLNTRQTKQGTKCRKLKKKISNVDNT
jgi:hypothetical protein